MPDHFPVQAPFHTQMLATDDGHNLHVAQFGNPQGKPVVYLHGGPGGGHSPSWQKYFDPEFYHLILFDQRGCGKSLPLADTENNSIDKLVSDIELIRKTLNIEKWIVGGGSWGSSLSMLYAKNHPQRVEHLILRGVFFATPEGAAHIAEEPGIQALDSKYFAQYRDFIPQEERQRDGLIRAYDRIMKTGDLASQREAAKRFMTWDNSIAFYDLENAKLAVAETEANPQEDIPITKIFMHYALNEFKADFSSQLLNVPEFHKIPIDIIHGEDDRICPVQNAFQLNAAYPHATLYVCKEAGHSGGEISIIDAHVAVSEKIRLAAFKI